MLKKLIILNLIALIYIFGFLLPIPTFADGTTTCTSFIKWYDGSMRDVVYVWSDNDLQLQATFATSTGINFPNPLPSGIAPYKEVCVVEGSSSVINASSSAETAYMIVSFSQLYFVFLTIILLVSWLVVALYRKK